MIFWGILHHTDLNLNGSHRKTRTVHHVCKIHNVHKGRDDVKGGKTHNCASGFVCRLETLLLNKDNKQVELHSETSLIHGRTEKKCLKLLAT